MVKKLPLPRVGNYFGMPIHNTNFADGTWLEGEEFAYQKGGFTRRAYATVNGVRRMCKCSIPDTYFSIPARVAIGKKSIKGFLSIDTQGLLFHCS